MASKAIRITTSDIARMAGVSQATVSLVLNRKANSGISPETEKRVLEAATKLGYLQPGQTISSAAMQRKFAVIVPDIINPYFSSLLSHISKRAHEHQLEMVVCDTHRSAALEREMVERLIANQVGGILYICTPTCMDLIEKAGYPLPMVLVGETTQRLDVSIIAADNWLAGRMLAEHLYELGHRHMAYITPPINTVSVLREQRLRGIVDFLRENGVETLHVYEQTSYLAHTEDAYEIATGQSQTGQILAEHPEITAIMGQGDLIAFGIYSALKEAGLRIPDDISVAAFDNIEYGKHLAPPLTTVDSKMIMRGEYGFDHLVKLMQNNAGDPRDPLFVTYRPALVLRNSTAAPRGGELSHQQSG